MSSYPALAPHVRLCHAGGDTIGLDLQRNRYFGLGLQETQVLQHLGLLVADERTVPDRSLLPDSKIAAITGALMRAGVLTTCQESAGPTLKPSPVKNIATPAASAGYEYNDALPLRPRHALDLIRAWCWARGQLAKQSFLEIVQHIESDRRRHGDAFDAERAIGLVNTFRLLRPFVYCARGRCLLHALTLTHFLGLHAQHPYWIVGVRTRPWAAHSWVQAGELVLDARPDDVFEYKPILIA